VPPESADQRMRPAEYLEASRRFRLEADALTAKFKDVTARSNQAKADGTFAQKQPALQAEVEQLQAWQARLDGVLKTLSEREPPHAGPTLAEVVAKQTATRTAAPTPALPWWQGVKAETVFLNCHYTGARNTKEFGTLKLTESGVQYKGPPIGGARLTIPWASIASIEINEFQAQHGHQYGAVGVGPVGLAVVGATLLHNRRAGKVEVRRAVAITNTQNQTAHFVAKKSSDRGFLTISGLIQRLSVHNAPNALRASPPRPSRASAISVADELTKLGQLRDAGVLTEQEFTTQKAKLLGS
jgi:hypothetical protein